MSPMPPSADGEFSMMRTAWTPSRELRDDVLIVAVDRTRVSETVELDHLAREVDALGRRSRRAARRAQGRASRA